MRVSGHSIADFRLPLTVPLHTAHGEVGQREGAILALRDASGRRGVGELAPLPGFGLESPREAREAAAEVAARLARAGRLDLEDALDLVDAATEKAPSARGALDTALHDLEAQAEGCSLATWLARAEGRSAREQVEVAALLRALDPAALASEARLALRAGHRALKLKIAAGGDDRARVAALDAVCPDGVELRLDANAAWTESEARERLAELASFRIAWVEQPVASTAALARLRREQSLPLAVDEGLAGVQAVEELTLSAAADVWVLKPAVVGGLRAARRIAARGRAAGVEVVVSGFLDAAVGAAAALALAAALPGDRPAGLDPVLARDLAHLAPIENGRRAVGSGAGLGLAEHLAP